MQPIKVVVINVNQLGWATQLWHAILPLALNVEGALLVFKAAYYSRVMVVSLECFLLEEIHGQSLNA